jgi:hypothetical protein
MKRLPRILSVGAAGLALALVTGCAAERGIATYQSDRYEMLPDDVVRVGDFWVRSASLDGSIAGHGFADQARVLSAQDDYGNVAVELATPTERGAVMHLIEFDAGLFDSLEPGTTVTYSDLEEGQMWPLACAGPGLDMWELDVPVQHMELTVEEGDRDGRLRLDWEVIKAPYDAPEAFERSHGELILDRTAPTS